MRSIFQRKTAVASPARPAPFIQRWPITLFLCKFVVLYTLLVLPWPGWEGIYGSFFRGLARPVFGSVRGERELTFERLGEPPHPGYTRIEIVNRRLMHADGSGPVRNLDLDPLGFGWKPTALVLALVAATPIAWRRRWRALLWGFACIQVIVLCFLAFRIWYESAEVALVTFTPFWKNAADGFNDLVIWQYTLVFPVVVWIFVTFRGEDLMGTIGRSFFGPASGGNGPRKEEAAAEAPKRAGE